MFGMVQVIPAAAGVCDLAKSEIIRRAAVVAVVSSDAACTEEVEQACYPVDQKRALEQEGHDWV